MKEKIEFNEKDQELLQRIRTAIEMCSGISKDIIDRHEEITDVWRHHRRQLISELSEEEWNRNDTFFAALYDLSVRWRSLTAIVRDSNHEIERIENYGKRRTDVSS